MVAAPRRKYLPMFVGSARTRIQRGQELLAAENTALVGEMHALAGEAALLGITEVVTQARAVEAAAKQWRASGAADARSACEETLKTLSTTVDRLATEA